MTQAIHNESPAAGGTAVPGGQCSAPQLAEHYSSVRQRSTELCAALVPEDYVVQAMPDVSPPKWHLAHTAWFFETFILAAYERPARIFCKDFAFLFNSYYETVGPFHARAQRGVLARPTCDEVQRYRCDVDTRMLEVLASCAARPAADAAAIAQLTELGLQHEQQHQELLLMDIKYNFFANPLRPAYRNAPPRQPSPHRPLGWNTLTAGVYDIGAPADGSFRFDNEGGRHKVYIEPVALADRLVTNAEYRAFMEAGGYQQADLWLSEGWQQVKTQGWRHPLYWVQLGQDWYEFTLDGLRPLDPEAPVCHVSYFEADAFARWRECRLPTEAEWEAQAQQLVLVGPFAEAGALHPLPASAAQAASAQFFGDLWQWTASAYAPYPGFRPGPGALGEYNGKFMCNQYVLRGGACVTPRSHVRYSYRNFFPAHSRWMFSGIRLAREE